MARIEVGRFILASYAYGWTVREKAAPKGYGVTYYGNLEAALKGLQDRRLRHAHAGTLAELRAALEAFRQEIAELLAGV